MSLEFLNQGIDHVEFVVEDLEKSQSLYQRMGFERVGTRDSRGFQTVVMAQGRVRIVLTRVDLRQAPKADYRTQFFAKHGDGICVLAMEVGSSAAAYQHCVSRGARSAMEPKRFESTQGVVVRSEIWTPEDIRYAFIERKNSANGGSKALFDEELEVDRLTSPSPFGFKVIDHLTNNVAIGEMSKWVAWYKQIFDCKVIRHFEISTGRTGLISDAVRTPDGRLTVPVNEATEPESQVQEFVDRFNGAGVQHLAMLTDDILSTVPRMKKSSFKFLNVPSTYYERVPSRVKVFTESLADLEQHQILIDSEGPGYLLQIFTEELVGPFFFEIIQRKGGNEGFGEGNFKALFEAIELDQKRRGTLK